MFGCQRRRYDCNLPSFLTQRKPHGIPLSFFLPHLSLLPFTRLHLASSISHTLLSHHHTRLQPHPYTLARTHTLSRQNNTTHRKRPLYKQPTKRTRMARLAVYGAISTILAGGVIASAFAQRSNFYSACIYLYKSNACMMVITARTHSHTHTNARTVSHLLSVTHDSSHTDSTNTRDSGLGQRCLLIHHSRHHWGS